MGAASRGYISHLDDAIPGLPPSLTYRAGRKSLSIIVNGDARGALGDGRPRLDDGRNASWLMLFTSGNHLNFTGRLFHVTHTDQTLTHNNNNTVQIN